MRPQLLLLLLLALLTSACELVVDKPTDTRDADDPPVAGQCCAVEEPSCDCFQTGGIATGFGCPTICDARPDGWVLDETGPCPELRDPGSTGGSGSCFFPLDAGVPDAFVPMDAALSTDAAD